MDMLLPAFLPDEFSPFRGLIISSIFLGKGESESSQSMKYDPPKLGKSMHHLFSSNITQQVKKRGLSAGQSDVFFIPFLPHRPSCCQSASLDERGTRDWIFTLGCPF